MDENDLRIQKELAKIGINHTVIISLGIAILFSGVATLFSVIPLFSQSDNIGSIQILKVVGWSLFVTGYIIIIAGLFWSKSRLDRVKITK